MACGSAASTGCSRNVTSRRRSGSRAVIAVDRAPAAVGVDAEALARLQALAHRVEPGQVGAELAADLDLERREPASRPCATSAAASAGSTMPMTHLIGTGRGGAPPSSAHRGRPGALPARVPQRHLDRGLGVRVRRQRGVHARQRLARAERAARRSPAPGSARSALRTDVASSPVHHRSAGASPIPVTSPARTRTIAWWASGRVAYDVAMRVSSRRGTRTSSTSRSSTGSVGCPGPADHCRSDVR